MSDAQDTFFTCIGCMDGRVQSVIAQYGKSVFSSDYPDTITEPGLDGMLPKFPIKSDVMDALKAKISISTDKHHSHGIVVHGHEDCAGNPVSEEQHKEDIRKSVAIVKELLKGREIPVKGVFVKVTPSPEVVEVA